MSTPAPLPGLSRYVVHGLLTDGIPNWMGAPATLYAVPGLLVPGCQADFLAVHKDFLISVYAVLPNNPSDDDVDRAIARLGATDDAVLRQLNMDLEWNDASVRLVVVAPGRHNTDHAWRCLFEGVFYLSSGISNECAGALGWLN